MTDATRKAEHESLSDSPDGYVEEGVKDYLDSLRESGQTNMFGAAEYLEEYFGVTHPVARGWLTHWMKTFGK